MNPNVPVVLVGNKVDVYERREVSREEAEEFARSLGLTHVEASAKTSMHVDGCFISLSELMLQKHQKESIDC